MKRKNLIMTIALGATAATLLVGTAAWAKGHGAGAMGHERPSFSALDTDGDGQITVAEMRAFAQARFGAMDGDGDGVLSAEEMATVAMEKARERADKMFARMLEWRDSDGDGALSQAEIDQGQAERMFSRFDANKDGVVTAEEFAKAGRRGPMSGRGMPGQHRGFGGQGHGG